MNQILVRAKTAEKGEHVAILLHKFQLQIF